MKRLLSGLLLVVCSCASAGKLYEEPNRPSASLPDIQCLPEATYNCMLGDKMLEDEELPKYLPLVNPAAVILEGGSCESVPLCFDKEWRLLGLNKELFSQH